MERWDDPVRVTLELNWGMLDRETPEGVYIRLGFVPATGRVMTLYGARDRVLQAVADVWGRDAVGRVEEWEPSTREYADASRSGPSAFPG